MRLLRRMVNGKKKVAPIFTGMSCFGPPFCRPAPPPPPPTFDQFNQSFPEFISGQVNPSLIAAMLAQATRRLSPYVFGVTYQDAVGYLTAHLLQISPLGFGTRLEPGQTTVYEVALNRLIEEAGVGTPVTAGGGYGWPGSGPGWWGGS